MISYNTELAKKFIHFFPAATYGQTWMNFLANLILPIMQIPLWQVILQVSSHFMLTEMNWELCPWKDILKEENIKLVDSEVQERVSRKEANWKGETEVASEKNIYFFFKIFFSYCLLLAVLGLGCCAGFPLVAGNRGFSFCGFSCCRAQARGCVGLFRLSGCVAWALLFHGLWYLSGPGIEPVPPALTGETFLPPSYQGSL